MGRWDTYREQSASNFTTMTLEGIGLPDFWVKLRHLGSYTTQEITEYETKWLQARIEYLTKRAKELAEAPSDIVFDETTKAIHDALAVGEGDITTEDIPEEQHRRLVMALVQQSSLQQMQPLSGIDIEMIYEWNILDNDDRLLPVPKEELTVLERVPMNVLWHIKQRLLELEDEVLPPKVKEMLSMRV